MSEPLRLLGVFAHPDDESLGCGGTLAKCAAEGIETYVVTATRGERGRIGEERPGAAVAGPIRERELHRAAAELGVHEVHLLDYLDGELDLADVVEAASRIAAHVRAIRPQVVVTFAADGSYGHPDHVAISQLTAAALVAAADPTFVDATGARPAGEPHRVSKLYWIAWSEATYRAYERALDLELGARVGGVDRRPRAWPEWSLTTRVDARAHWPAVWRAVRCHESQIAGYRGLERLTPAEHEALWGEQTFVRVFGFVDGGRKVEDDLFSGLRSR